MSHPIPFETLVALWAGELAPDIAVPIEEHLFSCDECSTSSTQLGHLLSGLRDVIPPVISHAHKERLVAAGLRVKELVIASPTAEAEFGSDLDLYIFALQAPVADAERVDLELWDEKGTPQAQFLAVPFDASRGEVLVACQRHYQAFNELLGAGAFRLFAHKDGERRQVGCFSIKHIWL